jgi:acyl-coenzyme A synthetase/AMP-(fatty) acid ligase
VMFVPDLPRNTVGKVLKRELRELVRDDIDNALAPS